MGPRGRSPLAPTRGRASSGQADAQVIGAAERYAAHARWPRPRIEPQVRESGEQRLDRAGGFEHREARARAVVAAEPEGEVRLPLAIDVEAVRIGEARLVAIGGADPEHQVAPARDPRARDLHVLDRHARDDLD